jgi:hypothetical protein
MAADAVDREAEIKRRSEDAILALLDSEKLADRAKGVTLAIRLGIVGRGDYDPPEEPADIEADLAGRYRYGGDEEHAGGEAGDAGAAGE